MGRLIGRTDWSGTPLGPLHAWSEALKAILDIVLSSAAPMALAWGPEQTVLFNDAWLGIVRRADAALGRSALSAPDAPWPTLSTALATVMAEGRRTETSSRESRLDFRLSPVFDATAAPAGVVVRTSGAVPRRVEWLPFALEFGQVAIWDWDLVTDTLEWSPGHFRLHGYEPGDVVPSYDLWAASLHPDDRDRVTAAVRRAQDTREPFESTFRIIRRDGAVRWCVSRGEPFLGIDAMPVRMLGTVQDITEHRGALEKQKTLTAELQHRVRNTLAVIRSITRRTAEASRTVEHLATHLEGRIDALGRAQTVFVRDPDGRIDLELLLREELRAAIADDDALEIEGPPVALTAKASESLALAFHELAANALKFGFLRVEAGRLSVRWSMVGGDAPHLDLAWHETGATHLMPPKHAGFGMELLKRTLPYDLNASVSLDFEPTGLACRLRLPLSSTVRQ